MRNARLGATKACRRFTDRRELLGGGDPGFIRILGTVYARGNFGDRASPCSGIYEQIGTGATCYLEPLPGAVVSTSLDGATATTGADGNFDLITTISRDHIDECRNYTVTITAAGHPTYSVPWSGFSGNRQGNEHRQRFILSPPTPSFVMGC